MQTIGWDHPAIEANGIPLEMQPHYPMLWLHPNGEVSALHRLAYHWTVHQGIGEFGYRDRWCYDDAPAAINAFIEWDGETGEPAGWKRHPRSGRRRLPTSEFRPELCFPEHGSVPVEVMPGIMEWIAF
jgi:hypothetical protein